MGIKQTFLAGLAMLGLTGEAATAEATPGNNETAVENKAPRDIPVDRPHVINRDAHDTPTLYVGFTGEHGLGENIEGLKNFAPPSPAQQADIKQVLDAYSKEFNINIVPVPLDAEHPDLSKVNLTIRTADFQGYKPAHLVAEETDVATDNKASSGRHDIVIDKNMGAEDFRYAFEHELGHILGLEHVVNKDKTETAMSTSPDAIGGQNEGPDPADFDRENLQRLYGVRDNNHPRTHAGLKVGVSGEHFHYADGEVTVTEENAHIRVPDNHTVKIGNDETFYAPESVPGGRGQAHLSALTIKGDGTIVSADHAQPLIQVEGASDVQIYSSPAFDSIKITNSEHTTITHKEWDTLGGTIALHNSSLTLENPNTQDTAIIVSENSLISRDGNHYTIISSEGVSTIDVKGEPDMLKFYSDYGKSSPLPVVDFSQAPDTWGMGSETEKSDIKPTPAPEATKKGEDISR